MNDEKIEKIQQELKQLSQKQVEIEKTHQQRIKSHEEQKTLNQDLFGQPPLQPDPELQSVKEEIARLDRRKQKYFEILQAAASIPPPVLEVDWSKRPLYWKCLAKFGFITPANNSMPQLSLLAGWLDLDMQPQTFTEPIISLNSLIARKKLKNGLIIVLEPGQPLSILSWLRTGLKDSNSEGFLAWGLPCCLSYICGQNESSRMSLLL